MAHTNKAPKQWALTKIETITSFKSWQGNLLYTLSTDAQFTRFLVHSHTWRKVSEGINHRGCTGVEDGPTAIAQCASLTMMLGQIANFCPIISPSSIVDESASLPIIWDRIRLHFWFKITGAAFIDFSLIKLEAQEHHEDLYQWLYSFVEEH